MSFKKNPRPVFGILEWFHLNDKEHVEKAIQQFQELGIKELRTGISWADYHRPGGEQWLEWLIPKLAEHVQILPCLLYTPPSVGIAPKTSSPPRKPEFFAAFTDEILTNYGRYFDWVELWNEPNNPSEYDYRLDPGWDIFANLINWSAKEASKHNKKVLMGGMSPVDPGWLGYMFEKGVMDAIDAVGIHGFPGSFDTNWPGWPAVIDQIRNVIDYHNGEQKIWITEVGYSTWRNDEKEQVRQLSEAQKAPVERMYWYCINDLDPKKPTVEGFHVDDREYHFGMVDSMGTPKLLYRMLKEYGVEQLENFEWITTPHITIPSSEKSILITGGAGFIGTNLAHHFLKKGKNVTLMDNLRRPGVEKNIEWLKKTHPKNLNIRIADVENKFDVADAIADAEFVYHLAAQVAVTTSFEQPVHDFKTNIMGTLNVLEAIRNSTHRPPLVFTSTNKVYGNLAGLQVIPNGQRYKMKNRYVDEKQKLDFYSPYGCSKGAADAYVLDYARIYGLQTVVFRMSCIYGPHQLGTEDQGWLAHFLIQALNGKSLTIYGDGKQVRDVLFVEDLVDAFHRVYEQPSKLQGQAFNIGGGWENSISLNEFIKLIEKLTGEKIHYSYDEWRSGDQKYYVSDTSKFASTTGWHPRHSIPEGIGKLYRWLLKSDLVNTSESVIV